MIPKVPLAALTAAVMLVACSPCTADAREFESKARWSEQFSINLAMFRANHLKQ